MPITSCRQPIAVAAFTLNRQAGTPAGVPQAKPILSHDVFLFTGHSPKRSDIQMPDFSDDSEQLNFLASLDKTQQTALMREISDRQDRNEPEFFTATLKDWWKRLHNPDSNTQSSSLAQKPRMVKLRPSSNSAKDPTKMPDFSTEGKQSDFIFAQDYKSAGRISKTIRALQKEGKDRVIAGKIACEQEWKRQKAKEGLPVVQTQLVEREIAHEMEKLTAKGADVATQFAAEMKIYQDSKVASRLGVYHNIIDRYSDLINPATTPQFLDQNVRAQFEALWSHTLSPDERHYIFGANNKQNRNSANKSNIDAAIVYVQAWQRLFVASHLSPNVIRSLLDQLKDDPQYQKLSSEQQYLKEMDNCSTIICALKQIPNPRSRAWKS